MGAALIDYDNAGERTVIRAKSRLDVEKIHLNMHPNPAIFALDFPKGMGVADYIRDIIYVVGDSPEVIEKKLAAAGKEKAFYEAMLGKAPPELKADRWLIGEPIRLADIKDREVIIHFWNIGCGPCVAEIARLQAFYGDIRKRADEPLFISVHSSVDAADIPEVQRFLKEKGITFPVMLDAADPEKASWGLTNKAYGVYEIPREATVDAKGRLSSVGKYKAAE